MKRPVTITGLDIGSSKICAVLGEVDAAGEGRIVSSRGMPSRGVQRGHVVDLNLAVDSVSRVLEALKDKSGMPMGEIYVNISGKSIKAERSRGMISLSMRGREITEFDMARCVNVASTIKLPFDADIIHKIVHSYTIDDQTELKNPLGLYGSRLAAEIYVITASVNQIQNLQKVINNCGYEIEETVFSAVADSHGIFDERDRRENVLLMDIGDSLTELAVFSEGVMKYIEVIPFGVSDMRAPLESDMGFGATLSRAKEALDDISAKGLAIRYILVAGGGSLLDGMLEAIEGKLKAPAKAAVAKGMGGSMTTGDAVIAATAMGLVRHAFRKHTPKPKEMPGGIIKRLSTKVVDVFNNYF